MKNKKVIAAGVLLIAKSTGRILLGKRASRHQEGNCWCIFGGTFDKKDRFPKTTAYREFFEETGVELTNISSEPIYVQETNWVQYSTYVSFFPSEFEPIINEEHTDYGWFDLESLELANIHPGMIEMFENEIVYNKIKKLTNG